MQRKENLSSIRWFVSDFYFSANPLLSVQRAVFMSSHRVWDSVWMHAVVRFESRENNNCEESRNHSNLGLWKWLETDVTAEISLWSSIFNLNLAFYGSQKRSNCTKYENFWFVQIEFALSRTSWSHLKNTSKSYQDAYTWDEKLFSSFFLYCLLLLVVEERRENWLIIRWNLFVIEESFT